MKKLPICKDVEFPVGTAARKRLGYDLGYIQITGNPYGDEDDGVDDLLVVIVQDSCTGNVVELTDPANLKRALWSVFESYRGDPRDVLHKMDVGSYEAATRQEYDRKQTKKRIRKLAANRILALGKPFWPIGWNFAGYH